ncbi:DUF7289 family protein [Haloarchaeobius sp. HRN-SO-5]|uniref:DUF7289 family protein n=1 Tax=Haloarchaeobius sp. HRN-SO-5 TaxID=3446118 RepID=UPI003EBF9AD8
MRRVPWEGGRSSDAVNWKERSERTTTRTERGQSSVLAVVLLVGIVAVGMVAIAVVGANTISEWKGGTEDERIEDVFVQLGQDINSVAYGQGSSESVNFDIRTREGAVHHDNTGHIKVYTENQTIADQSFGSVEYVRDDSTFAYQAGGVWRGTGANAQMVASPSLRYRDGTLNVPIPVVTGDDSLSSGAVTIRKNGTRAPINNMGYIQGELVTVEITSEYYGGWAEYLRSNTNDASVTVDHANETVIMKLGRPMVDDSFSDGVYVTGGGLDFEGGNAEVNGSVFAEGNVSDESRVDGNVTENVDSDLPELDDVIESKIETARNDSSVIDVDPENGGDTLDGGNTYYDDDGFTMGNNDDVTVDLSGGNVTLIVNGSMSLDGGHIDVTNGAGDKAFRVYSNGNFGMRGSTAGVQGESQYLQIYGTSEMQVAITGGSDTNFYGTIYAPRDDPVLDDTDWNQAALSNNTQCVGWDTCISTGGGSFEGAIVAGPTLIGQSVELVYDTDLSSYEPTLQLENGLYPPPITYLHVSVHEVTVDDGDESLRAPPLAGSADARARAAQV